MEKQKGYIVVIGNTAGAFIESFKIRHDYLLYFNLQRVQLNLPL